MNIKDRSFEYYMCIFAIQTKNLNNISYTYLNIIFMHIILFNDPHNFLKYYLLYHFVHNIKMAITSF